MVTRRQLIPTMGMVALTGCLDNIPIIGSDGYRLGKITVDNLTYDTEQFELSVEEDEDVIFDNTITVPGQSRRVPDIEFSSSPSVYTLHYGLPREEKSEMNLTSERDNSDHDDDNDCMVLFLAIRDDGRIFETGNTAKDLSAHKCSWDQE